MIATNANGCDRSLFERWGDAKCGIWFAVCRRGVSDASVSVALEVAQHQFARRYSARASSSGQAASVSRRSVHAARDLGAGFVVKGYPGDEAIGATPFRRPGHKPHIQLNQSKRRSSGF